MKKRKQPSLYPAKEDISIENFILENPNLIMLIILIVVISLIFVFIFASAPYLTAEHVYNYL